MRTTRRSTTLTLGLSLLALAACGDGGAGTGGTGADQSAKRKDATLAYARCMREQGIDMPDPKTDENGMLVIEGGGPDTGTRRDPDFEKADGACRKHLLSALPPKLDEEQQKEFKQRALEHARCMREEGIDFPDPRIGEGGEVSVEIGGESGIDPASPKFQAAQKKCGSPLGAREPAE